MQSTYSALSPSQTLKREPSKSLLRKPLYNRLENALRKEDIELLVEKAKMHRITTEAENEMANSRCFCINAIARWDKNLKVELLPKTFSLLSHDEWDTLAVSVQSAALKAIEILGKQAQDLGAIVAGKESLVNFELIRLPLSAGKLIPDVEWHRDVGFFESIEERPFCYADYTTVIMLTNPTWSGGHLEIQRNGEKSHDKPPKKGSSTTESIQYLFNEAATFYNIDARHRVTPIQSEKGSEDRIVFIASIYSETETNYFRRHHKI